MHLRKIIKKAFAALLFIMPALFFLEVYLLQAVSAEDLFQGAGTPPSVINDALGAFHWSSRLSDMYAWSVINYFDYTFQFGVDTIFRFIDVLMAIGILYIMVYIITERRPRLEIKDGLIFCITFLAIFLSIYSRPILAGFSQIHNYLLICLFSALFLLPFARLIRGKNLHTTVYSSIAMLAVGFLFAFSSNVLPATFLITAFLVISYNRIHSKSIKKINLAANLWQIFALLGMAGGMFVMYVLGPGYSSYTHGYNSSYVSIQSLIYSPIPSGLALISNAIHNFELVTPVLIIMSLITLFEYLIYKKKLLPKSKETIPGVKFSIVLLVFYFIHILAVSQVNVGGMTRLLLPAYLVALVSILFTVNRILIILSVRSKILIFISLPIILITALIVFDIGILMIRHQKQASTVFQRIKNSPNTMACVTPADNPTAKSPFLKYYQRELFIGWMMPTTIYGKKVDWCK